MQLPTAPPAAPIVLRALGLSKRYGARKALTDVEFELRAGELLAVVGPNGAGKTTLLSILAGTLHPDSGTVESGAQRPGWVPQQAAVYSRLTVAENLMLFARLEGVDDARAATAAMLARMDLEGRAGTPAAHLSGGLRQRLNVAVGMIAGPPVLLLDEPSAALDPLQRERLWSLVAELAAAGTAVVYSTHDITEVERHAERALVIDQGRVRFAGPPQELARSRGAAGFEQAFLGLLDGAD